MADNRKPVSELAQEFGEALISAADDLKRFTPDLIAKFPIELDGVGFEISLKIAAPPA